MERPETAGEWYVEVHARKPVLHPESWDFSPRDICPRRFSYKFIVVRKKIETTVEIDSSMPKKPIGILVFPTVSLIY